jgi:hypothetical protein
MTIADDLWAKEARERICARVAAKLVKAARLVRTAAAVMVEKEEWFDEDDFDALPGVADQLTDMAARAHQPPSAGGVDDGEPFDRRCADVMAAAVDVMVHRGQLDSRSIVADARLDYGEPWTLEGALAILHGAPRERP